jgi:protein-histidine pros-kinase
MKKIFPDTIFARLFALAVAAILLMHAAFTLAILGVLSSGFFASNGVSPPPPPSLLGLLLITAIQLAILTPLAWFGARMVARPIEKLTQAASQLGENIHACAIEETGPEETRQAARIFNIMQERIRSYVDERAQFLAAVSHDLRTPLTRMGLRVERLPGGLPQEKLRDDIAEMSALLNTALDYLRGNAADEPLVLLDVQALVESMAENAVENGASVEVTGAAGLLHTRHLALRRCLTNLIENAIRYGLKASISLTDAPDSLVIEIRDDGPGIPEEQLQAVFGAFIRLEVSRNKETGGLGLGLPIARDAAAQCGGSLALRNAPQGGLIASLILPRTIPVPVSGEV